ncbi:hypothetical protein PanWU01x14_244960 [Parasponia andersonii]|uniref:Uncharacterized protein n=1 Tax=Parasponia andersonii TaxID=3476 RepID=A0A2P5BEV3_PARAD|nr:hypothetical protein PanWU01x14_244960 [Parasponia andersonii]
MAPYPFSFVGFYMGNFADHIMMMTGRKLRAVPLSPPPGPIGATPVNQLPPPGY